MRLYRRTLALPGVRTLMVLVFFARIPLSAAGMVLTLHVAVGLGHGYGAAGAAGAVVTIGIAVGAPVMGRVVDRYGLRPMVLVTTACEAAFWVLGRYLPYPGLLVAGFVGGLLVLPVMSIARQAVAALVPPDLRRTAYSMDSISAEMSFMVGPAMAVVLVTQFSSATAMLSMAIGIAAVGAALFLVNPAVRSEQEKAADTGERVPRRVWLTPRMIAVLVIGAGAVFILAGTEVAIVAQLRENGELTYTSIVVTVWAAVSAVGGLVYGALSRSPGQVTLMAWLGLLTIPIGLVGGSWWMLTLVLLPASALCAPTIAATGEGVARLAPATARGEASGLQSSAFTLGSAAGAPLVGFVVDHSSPAWGFAVAGAGGVLVAGLAAVLIARQRRAEPVVTVPA
ncbi:MFS transporter [Actinophytocola xanthii]|uniref:MFS transporter n=1 Tax=Actinophytocola xanthii TaxID=1912961 RepID=A0A1Q8CNJ1_9PSEU|nr:MFS transporter [Actinophytocola xanthii]OLF15900.1 MFS transporter [Actinophytocola xanthii]